jgi:hypothetical protein
MTCTGATKDRVGQPCKSTRGATRSSATAKAKSDGGSLHLPARFRGLPPAPEQPTYVALFEESVYRYTYRHQVKSGITGWAQVNGLRGDTSIEEQVLFDNYYIENWSFWLDIRIILLTLFKSGISAAERSSTRKRSSTPQG